MASDRFFSEKSSNRKSAPPLSCTQQKRIEELEARSTFLRELVMHKEKELKSDSSDSLEILAAIEKAKEEIQKNAEQILKIYIEEPDCML